MICRSSATMFGWVRSSSRGRISHWSTTKIRPIVAQLGAAAGISTGMLSKVENGATSPWLATLYALATASEVYEFFGGCVRYQ